MIYMRLQHNILIVLLLVKDYNYSNWIMNKHCESAMFIYNCKLLKNSL